MFKKFKKLETSKKLITLVSAVWALSIVAGFIGLSFGFSFIPVITIVNIDFLVVLGYYFTKAGTENVVKGLFNERATESAHGMEDTFIPEERIE